MINRMKLQKIISVFLALCSTTICKSFYHIHIFIVLLSWISYSKVSVPILNISGIFSLFSCIISAFSFFYLDKYDIVWVSNSSLGLRKQCQLTLNSFKIAL
jgi:hypothetical protein